jgi:hypothetical protein
MQVSSAAGELSHERISLIQLAVEAISFVQCQILQLLQEHRTRVALLDPQIVDLAHRACLQELRELCNLVYDASCVLIYAFSL